MCPKTNCDGEAIYIKQDILNFLAEHDNNLDNNASLKEKKFTLVKLNLHSINIQKLSFWIIYTNYPCQDIFIAQCKEKNQISLS